MSTIDVARVAARPPVVNPSRQPTPPSAIDDARRYLSAIFGAAPAGSWAGIMRLGAFGAGAWRRIGDVDAFGELARLAVDAGQDVYVNVAPTAVRPPKGKRNKADDAAALTCLWTEFDGLDSARRLTRVERAVGRCSVAVASGGGVHAYWLLRAPVTGSEAVKATLSAWRARLIELGAIEGGENVQDAARVLRVPGTVNAKLDRPRPVRLLRCELNTRYHVADLAPPLPATVTTAAPTDSETSSTTSPSSPTPYGRAALTDEAERLAAAKAGTRHCTTLRAAFRLGQLGERHGLTLGDVVDALLGASHANGRVADDGQAAARRDIVDAFAAGQAKPSDRGRRADSDAWIRHRLSVDDWQSAALSERARAGARRTLATDCAILAAMADIARAAGPGGDGGELIVDASRHRLARHTGFSHETCRRALVRLGALGVLDLAVPGGLRGYDVAAGRARKVANGWTLHTVQRLSEISDDRASAGAASATEGGRCAVGADAGRGHRETTDNPCTVSAGAPGQDALVAALGRAPAMALRILLRAGCAMTKAELAAEAGVSRSTMSRASGVPRLVARGVVKAEGERKNARGESSPLYVAKVGCEAEAAAMLGAEDAQARLGRRRADDWQAMTDQARVRCADAFARRANAAAGQYRVLAPVEVADLADAIRRPPVTDAEIIAAVDSATRRAAAVVLAELGIVPPERSPLRVLAGGLAAVSS